MIKDKLTELSNALEEDESLSGISIKSFERPETLGDDETSIVIIPVGPPMQEQWIPDIKRYVDARTYKGQSALYEEY